MEPSKPIPAKNEGKSIIIVLVVLVAVLSSAWRPFQSQAMSIFNLYSIL